MKDNLKLKVAIDGDNKGFKRALTSTQRDIGKMQEKTKRGGLGFGDLIGLGAISQVPKAIKAVAARKMMNSRKSIAEVQSIREMKHSMRHNDGSMTGNQVNLVNQRLADHRATKAKRNRLRADAMPLQQVKMMLPAIIAGLATTAVIATIANKFSNMNKFDAQSKQFSGSVMAHEAQLEVAQIRRNLARAKDPTFVAQQKRLASAQFYSQNSGTSANGRNLGADVATTWEYLKGYVTNNPDVLWNPLRANYDIAKGIF